MNFHMILILNLRFVEIIKVKEFYTALLNNTLFFKFKIVTRIENKTKTQNYNIKVTVYCFRAKKNLYNIVKKRKNSRKYIVTRKYFVCEGRLFEFVICCALVLIITTILN